MQPERATPAKAEPFWRGVARLVVAMLIVLLIVFGILTYLASQTLMSSPG